MSYPVESLGEAGELSFRPIDGDMIVVVKRGDPLLGCSVINRLSQGPMISIDRQNLLIKCVETYNCMQESCVVVEDSREDGEDEGRKERYEEDVTFVGVPPTPSRSLVPAGVSAK